MGDEGGPNLYQYAVNSPAAIVDPLGLYISELEAAYNQHLILLQQYPGFVRDQSAPVGSKANRYAEGQDGPAVDIARASARRYMDDFYPANRVVDVNWLYGLISGCCQWTQTGPAKEVGYRRVVQDQETIERYTGIYRRHGKAFPNYPGRGPTVYWSRAWGYYFSISNLFQYNLTSKFILTMTCTKGRKRGTTMQLYKEYSQDYSWGSLVPTRYWAPSWWVLTNSRLKAREYTIQWTTPKQPY